MIRIARVIDFILKCSVIFFVCVCFLFVWSSVCVAVRLQPERRGGVLLRGLCQAAGHEVSGKGRTSKLSLPKRFPSSVRIHRQKEQVGLKLNLKMELDFPIHVLFFSSFLGHLLVCLLICLLVCFVACSLLASLPSFVPAPPLTSIYPPTHSLHLPAHSLAPSTRPLTRSIYPPTHSLHLPAHSLAPSARPLTRSIYPPTHSLHLPAHSLAPSTRPLTRSIYPPTHSLHLPAHSLAPSTRPLTRSICPPTHSLHLPAHSLAPSTRLLTRSIYPPTHSLTCSLPRLVVCLVCCSRVCFLTWLLASLLLPCLRHHRPPCSRPHTRSLVCLFACLLSSMPESPFTSIFPPTHLLPPSLSSSSQISDNPRHGGALRGPDGAFPSAEHQVRLEERFLRLPFGCVRHRRGNRRAGVPDHRYAATEMTSFSNHWSVEVR